MLKVLRVKSTMKKSDGRRSNKTAYMIYLQLKLIIYAISSILTLKVFYKMPKIGIIS